MIGENVKIEEGNKFETFITIRDRVFIGKNNWIKENVKIYSDAKIGNSCKIRSDCVICEDAEIGDKVEFGCGVHLVNHVKLCAFNKKIEDIIIPPKIGSFSRIGGNTTIHAGCVIGNNCIILPHSQVMGTIPSGQLWGGSPAKFIRDLKSDEIIDE